MVFIIPQENRSIIAKWDGSLEIAGKVDIPYNSKSVVTDNGLIVAICLGKKTKNFRLKIFDLNGKQLVRSTEHKFTCIAAKGNVVYLGGQYKKGERELFSVMDLTNADFTSPDFTASGLVAVDVPLPDTRRGKSVDDILVRDNSLILVDNIVFPKYLFAYDITERVNPKHSATKKLPNNGTYEHIYKGDINEDTLVLFSGSVGRRGVFRHISVIKGRDIAAAIDAADPYRRQRKHDGTLTLKVYDHETEEENDIKNIIDIALLGNCLAVLTKRRLCRFDPDKSLLEENLETLQANEDGWERLIKLDSSHCLLVKGAGYEVKEM
jgi:hypothetical protein